VSHHPAQKAADAAARLAASRRLIEQRLAANGLDAAGHAGASAGSSVGLLADWAWSATQPGEPKQPLRHALTLAGLLAQQRVAPLAQRHPFAVIGAAAVAGALLACARPWRWVLRPAVAASLLGLASNVVSGAVSQAASQWLRAPPLRKTGKPPH
jgi:hypothetical protein